MSARISRALGAVDWRRAAWAWSPPGRRSCSGLAMTQGGMYNWRVQAVSNALEKRGLGEGPLEIRL